LARGANRALKTDQGFTAHDIAMKKNGGWPADLLARLDPKAAPAADASSKAKIDALAGKRTRARTHARANPRGS